MTIDKNKYIELNIDWRHFDNGKSIGQKGSENGIIIYDIEHFGGARITLEQETEIAPFATTLGIYGVMMHTHYDSNEFDAEMFIEQSIQKIETLLELYDIPEEKRDNTWNQIRNKLVDEIVEQ